MIIILKENALNTRKLYNWYTLYIPYYDTGKISFEGASIFDVWYNILILVIWGIIVYAIAVKVFKWE